MTQTFCPLAGIRVLCLAPLLPGPYAAMVLADLGADVVILENPPRGEPTRAYPGVFEATGRGKRSLALDLKSARSREALLRVADTVDAVIEGFSPGTADRLGVGPAGLRDRNPALVYVSISGFGQDSPLRDVPGHDVIYQAAAGVLSWGPDGPVLPTVPIADLAAGTAAVAAVTSGLVQALRAREGVFIDLSMTDVLVSWLTPFLQAALADPDSGGTPQFPGYGIYPTLDRHYLAFGVTFEDHFWVRLCTAVDLPELTGIGAAERVARFAELDGMLRERIRSRTRGDWEPVLTGRRVPFSPVLRPAAAAASEHVRHRGLRERAAGFPTMRQPLLAPGLERKPVGQVPTVGEHTAEVLAEAGLSAAEIDEVLADEMARAGRNG